MSAAAWLLAGIVATLALPTAVSAALPRSTVDRTDTLIGKQIHVMYVLPSDRPDRSLDTSGTLENSVNSFQSWLSSKTGGEELRLDRYAGSLDVTFFRLARSDATIASYGPYVRDQIEADLHAAGFNAQNKIYAVYYDGTSTFSCGGAAWPPALPGNVAAIYLNGLPSYNPPCSANPFAVAGAPPGYLEFSMLHEILHVMGIVATCAPNEWRSGHVSDNADDLMWAGDGVWVPSGWANVILDYNNDDYFRRSNPGCLDLENTGFLTGGPLCTGDAGGPCPTSFFTVTPCRVVDTRDVAGPLGGPALSAATARSFLLAEHCGVPSTARSVSVNLTVTQPSAQGHLTVYPSGSSLPLASTMNYRAGQTRANNAILPLGTSGGINVVSGQPSGTVHFILDVNGYFE